MFSQITFFQLYSLYPKLFSTTSWQVTFQGFLNPRRFKQWLSDLSLRNIPHCPAPFSSVQARCETLLPGEAKTSVFLQKRKKLATKNLLSVWRTVGSRTPGRSGTQPIWSLQRGTPLACGREEPPGYGALWEAMDQGQQLSRKHLNSFKLQYSSEKPSRGEGSSRA